MCSDALLSVIWMESHASKASCPCSFSLGLASMLRHQPDPLYLSSEESDRHLLCSPMWLILLYESNIFLLLSLGLTKSYDKNTPPDFRGSTQQLVASLLLFTCIVNNQWCQCLYTDVKTHGWSLRQNPSGALAKSNWRVTLWL